MSTKSSQSFGAVLALTGLSLALVGPANAAKITVTGDCSLEEAIANANANATIYPDCTPEVPAVGYNVKGFDRIFIERNAVRLDTEQTITGDLLIRGLPTREDTSTDDTTTIKGGLTDTERLFYVEPGVRVDLRHLTLRGGVAHDKSFRGGCLYNNGGDVVIRDSVVKRCEADGDGGAIYNTATGDLTIERTIIKQNDSGDDGGAIANREGGTVQLKGSSECFRNTADAASDTANGGCLDSRDENSYVHIRNALCFENEAGGNGGCLYTGSLATARISFPATTVIEDNSAYTDNGGGVGTDDATSVTITGNGSYIANNTPNNCDPSVTTKSGAICN